MEDSSLQAKQELLRNEVIHSGIDAEAFMEYIGTVKNEGDNIDLNNWTIQELKEVIVSFKKQIVQQNTEIVSSRVSREFMKSKIFDKPREEIVKYEGTQLWDYAVKQEQECEKSPSCVKIQEGLRPLVKIEKFQVKSVGGFLFGLGSKNELQMTISTNFTSVQVARKSQDCNCLRNILILTFPGFFVPPLEQDRELAIEDKRGIAARIAEIEKFLNSVMKYPIFQTSRFLKQFFEQANAKKFSETKKRESSIAMDRDISLIQTPSGKFTVQISDTLNKTLKRASVVSTQINSLYGDMNTCSGKILQDMDSANKHLRILGDICAKIGERYGELQILLKHDQMKAPSMLLSLNNTVSLFGKNLRRHIKAFSDFSESYIKNAVREWNEFVIHDKRQQTELKTYLSSKQSLLKKKQKFCSDLSKWELPQSEYQQLKKKDLTKMPKKQCFERMFPNDNDNEARLRLWVAFLNQNYLLSFKQYLTHQQEDLINYFLAYSEEYLALNAETVASYGGFREMILQE